MRGLTAALAAVLARPIHAARRLVLEARLGLADWDLQILETHARRMAAERAELSAKRDRLAVALVGAGNVPNSGAGAASGDGPME